MVPVSAPTSDVKCCGYCHVQHLNTIANSSTFYFCNDCKIYCCQDCVDIELNSIKSSMRVGCRLFEYINTDMTDEFIKEFNSIINNHNNNNNNGLDIDYIVSRWYSQESIETLLMAAIRRKNHRLTQTLLSTKVTLFLFLFWLFLFVSFVAI